MKQPLSLIEKQSNVFLFHNSSHLLNHKSTMSLFFWHRVILPTFLETKCHIPSHPHQNKNKNKNLEWREERLGLGLDKEKVVYLNFFPQSWMHLLTSRDQTWKRTTPFPFHSPLQELVILEGKEDKLRTGGRELPWPHPHSSPSPFLF